MESEKIKKTNFCDTCKRCESEGLKYQVVRCNTSYYTNTNEEDNTVKKNDLDCNILGTFNCRKSAVEFMSLIVDKNHKDQIANGWYRVYHDNCNTISVYQCGVFGGKYLLCKYHILEYSDIIFST